MSKVPMGQAIRAVRKQRGFTQLEITKRTGWYRTLLPKIERGVRSVKVDELVEVAEAMEVMPAKLLNYAIRNKVNA